ncbi:cache domain-containing protein [bacterium]|nr:cache domain-containing protein [bacterium]
MIIKTPVSLSRTVLYSMLIVISISFGVGGYLWFEQEVSQFGIDSQILREDYVEQQKKQIKEEVEKGVDYAKYMMAQTEKRLHDNIKNRVYEAHGIATNLYHRYKDTLPPGQLQNIIKEALRPIRFSEGKGYYFATRLDGLEILFADRPEMEGINMLNTQDTQGKYVIRDMIDIVNKKGEGFYSYTWTKPNASGSNFRKTTFVKHFEPYGWLIGTGEYIDDVREVIQNEALQRLIEVRFGKDGYLFGSTFEGDPLFTNGRITVGTRSVWDLTDPEGIKIIQEQKKAAKIPEGSYYHYSWIKLQGTMPSPKISFTKAIPEWGWMIGAGAYVDDIETAIDQRRLLLTASIKAYLLKTLLVLACLILVVLFLVHIITSKTRQGFDRFTAFFEKASNELVEIRLDDLHFSEFSKLADIANQMVRNLLAATQTLRMNEEKYRMLFHSVPLGIIVTDKTGEIIETNSTSERLLGWSKSDHKTRRIDADGWKTIRSDGTMMPPSEYASVRALKENRIVGDIEMGILSLMNQKTWISVTAAPIPLDNYGVLVVYTDITDRKLAEEKIKASLKEKEVLLQEIHHRVKNNMQVIASLLKLQSNSINDIQIKDALKESQNRVYAMSAIYEILHHSDDLSQIDLKFYLSKMGRMLLQTYSIIPGKISLNIESDNIRLNIDKASPLGLVFNELISNSLKYAFPENGTGTVNVSVKLQGEECELIVWDDGVGMKKEFDWRTSTTLGLQLVRTLVENQLDGSIELVSGDGAKFLIRFNTKES